MTSAVDFELSLLPILLGDAGLSALVGDRIFPLVIPTGSRPPCVTFRRLAGTPANALSGPSGLEEISLQVDAWALDYAEAKDIAKAVREAVPAQGPRFGARLVADHDLYEDKTGAYRIRMEYRIWFLETDSRSSS